MIVKIKGEEVYGKRKIPPQEKKEKALFHFRTEGFLEVDRK